MPSAPPPGWQWPQVKRLKAEWAALRAQLAEIETSDVAAVNEWARSHAVPHVSPMR